MQEPTLIERAKPQFSDVYIQEFKQKLEEYLTNLKPDSYTKDGFGRIITGSTKTAEVLSYIHETEPDYFSYFKVGFNSAYVMVDCPKLRSKRDMYREAFKSYLESKISTLTPTEDGAYQLDIPYQGSEELYQATGMEYRHRYIDVRDVLRELGCTEVSEEFIGENPNVHQRFTFIRS